MPKSSIISGGDAPRGVMSPQQSRAARGWLGWSQDEFAKQANVALRTIASFERGEIMPRRNNIAAMQHVIESEGIELLFDETGLAAGIVRKDARVPRLAGEAKSLGDRN